MHCFQLGGVDGLVERVFEWCLGLPLLCPAVIISLSLRLSTTCLDTISLNKLTEENTEELSVLLCVRSCHMD